VADGLAVDAPSPGDIVVVDIDGRCASTVTGCDGVGTIAGLCSGTDSLAPSKLIRRRFGLRGFGSSWKSVASSGAGETEGPVASMNKCSTRGSEIKVEEGKNLTRWRRLPFCVCLMCLIDGYCWLRRGLYLLLPSIARRWHCDQRSLIVCSLP
jgi:hypothetical protein